MHAGGIIKPPISMVAYSGEDVEFYCVVEQENLGVTWKADAEWGFSEITENTFRNSTLFANNVTQQKNGTEIQCCILVNETAEECSPVVVLQVKRC